MKKSVLFIIIFATVTFIQINAQKLTALHSTDTILYFSGESAFKNAYNAAVNGDTIYLPGASLVPPTNINKTLVIYGTGHYADSTSVTSKTVIQGTLVLDENADNSHFEGFDINGDLYFTANKSISGVVVKRCKMNNISIEGTLNQSLNLAFIGSVINHFNIPNAQNVLIANNIIISGIRDSHGNVISNNIFLNSFYSYGYFCVRGNSNTITNNILISESSIDGSGNNVFNNLFTWAVPYYGANPVQSGNYTGIAQADIFVNQSGTTFDYAHNYHLKSPTLYIGTDVKEVGIYGGNFPYKEGAVPGNPHIQFENIAPSATNGLLHVHIKAAAQTH